MYLVPGVYLVPGGVLSPGVYFVLGGCTWFQGGGGVCLEGVVCSAWVCSWGGGVVSQHALRQTPPPWTESQTPAKTLPWPNFVAAGKNSHKHFCQNNVKFLLFIAVFPESEENKIQYKWSWNNF